MTSLFATSFTRWRIFLLFALSFLMAHGACAAERIPNILYILADDLGIGDVGCYGQDILRTPRIDRLAAEGLRFTEHYTGSSMCAPTRSCLMTGQHTGHTRVRTNGDGPLLPEDVTIAEVLAPAGYRTGVIGKWGIGEEGTTGVPLEQGFDFWFGYLNQSNAHHYYPPFLWRNEKKQLYPDNPKKRTHYSHDEMTREGLDFIKRNRDQPFFLYMAYTLVHVDLDVPDESRDSWIGAVEETAPYGTPGGQHYRYEEKPHATFAGMVSRLDRDVGRLVDLVDELGLGENTLVIFSSDNGPTSAGGADPEFFNGNGPWRGIKFDFYEGGIRCPMIARWPGTISKGSVTDHLSAHWDVLPTLAELAGADPPEEIDGISFAPTLLQQPERQQSHDHLYWEHASKGGWQVVREGKWKGHRLGTQPNRTETFELYDLENDPAEATNVAGLYPEVVTRLRGVMSEGRAAPVGKKDALFEPAKPKKKKTKKP